MRQVFRTRPWVQPREPDQFIDVFRHQGTLRSMNKGAILTHGGAEAEVWLLLDGLVTFNFLDNHAQNRIFGLILPGRTIGDLDALNPSRTKVVAEVIRPSRFLILKQHLWREAMRESIDTMELYADLSILKEECFLEGMAANFTLDLDHRLRVLMLAILHGSNVNIQPDDFNDSPVQLTVTEYAQIVAANRSWVSTKISEWVSAGLIEKQGRTLRFHGSLFTPVHDWMHTMNQVRPIAGHFSQ